MSIKRRKFLQAGSLAALFAAMPLKRVLGQSWKDRDGNPLGNYGQSGTLANYSKATFESYLNSIFQFYTSTGVLEVTLAQIHDMPAPANGECFTLFFHGEVSRDCQDTYTVTHPSLGTFELFVVRAADKKGTPGYLATINRLSLADFAMTSVPAKSAQSAMPSARSGSAPSVGLPALSPIPTFSPNVTRSRGTVRRSSWKILDLELDQDQ